MIVYVETNFVIEMALEQEQHTFAHKIIELAEKSQIELAFPNFILSESFECVLQTHRKRNSLHESLIDTLGELKRSEPHRQIMVDLRPVISVLRSSQDRELVLLHSTLDTLINVGKCLEIKIDGIKRAVLYRKELDLDPKDSIIYSTIIDDLKEKSFGEKKCFLSRDKKAFGRDDDHRIKDELQRYNCIHIGSFYNGLLFIQNQLFCN